MTVAAPGLPRQATRVPAAVAGAAAVLVGVTVLAGWISHTPELVQVRPGQVPMQFNTAMCLALLGVALLLLLGSWFRFAVLPLAVVTFWGAGTVTEYVTRTSLGIDRLLFDPWLVIGVDTPGRMARNTALCFTVLGGTALWLVVSGRRPGAPPLAVGLASSLVAGLALVALFGYVGNVAPAYTWRTSTAMAPHTAATFLLLAIGYVAAAWGVATTRGAPRWLPVPVGVCALATTLFLWQALVNLHSSGTRTISLDRAAGGVLGIGLVFSLLLALATALGQNARARRREAERLTGELKAEAGRRTAIQGALLERAERDAVLRAAYGAVSAASDLAEGFAAFSDAAAVGLSFDRATFCLVDDGVETLVAESGPDAGAQSHAAVPVVIAGEPRALLGFASVRPGAFGTDDLAFAGDLANVVGGALYTLARLAGEQETSARLRELDQLKNEFVGVVAHDLRSPMTVIAGYVDTVLQRWDELPDPMKRELLGVASRNTKRLSVMVEDVLQVARIESGDFPYDIRAFDLGALVRRTVDEMNAARPDRPVCAELPGAPDLPTALGDEDRQWQVLTNLISNAQKFSPPDTPVTVSVRARETDLEVSVADRGPGIPADDLTRLFGKFARLAPAPGGEKGTGLGLYICKALVEAQGGTIAATSRVGAGTTLRYTVPRTREQGR